MEFQGTIIEDTFAEAFRMWAARLIVTAADESWVRTAVAEVTGYGSSVIGCDAEGGLERVLLSDETPDGRPGASVLFFAFNADKLGPAVASRVGQCLMTCPTTAVFDGLPHVTTVPKESARLDLGKKLRFFGDGNQKSKVIDGRRFWRIPVMDGEFFVDETIGAVRAIGGGNFLVCGTNQASTLAATQRAVQAIGLYTPEHAVHAQSRAALSVVDRLPGVVTPFPGGIVRSGSKVGSRYKGMFASSNDEFSPTLVGRSSKSKLRPDVTCVYEVVINGLNEKSIAEAMRVGIARACGSDVLSISAGNYGGNLGKFHFKLHEVMHPIVHPKPASNVPIGNRTLTRQRFAPPAGYTFEWRDGALKLPEQPLTLPMDGGVFRPDVLGKLELAQVERVRIQIGRDQVALAEIFEISGEPGDTLTLRGAPAIHRMGAQMASGRLIIDGAAGDDLGASMQGGLIRVYGQAGHRVGGPDAGFDRGMTGGTILVTDDVGDLAGTRMRKGLIVVGGRAGPRPGYRMLAGTIALMTGPMDTPGLEMRRGTIICLDPMSIKSCRLPLTAAAGVFDSSSVIMLRVMANHLIDLGCAIDHRAIDGRYLLISNDPFELNRGDIWQWVM